MIRRLLAAACCLAVVGCGAAAPQPSGPAPTTTVAVSVPADGVLLSSLGYRFAPKGFSVPATSVISEHVDQENTVVAVFSAPNGEDIAEHLRQHLPRQGWDITADGNDSLLFERGKEHGAFTVSDSVAALSIRWDERS